MDLNVKLPDVTRVDSHAAKLLSSVVLQNQASIHQNHWCTAEWCSRDASQLHRVATAYDQARSLCICDGQERELDLPDKEYSYSWETRCHKVSLAGWRGLLVFLGANWLQRVRVIFPIM